MRPAENYLRADPGEPFGYTPKPVRVCRSAALEEELEWLEGLLGSDEADRRAWEIRKELKRRGVI